MIANRRRHDRIEDLYALSPMQQGMLFHTLYAPGTGAYLGQSAWEIRGDLDAAALRAAWQGVLDRHAVLRTAFFWEGLDEPTQVVCRGVELPWEELDWRGEAPAERGERLRALLDEDRRRGFELGEPPLTRLVLVRAAEGVWWLCWTYHHLLLDGWCLAHLFREVLALYDGERRGRPARLPVSRPYRDYIAWLSKQDRTRAEAFWRRLLAGIAAPTALGLERPCAAGAGRGERRVERFALPARASDLLRSLGQRSRVTLNTVVQGAWGLLLGRYSGQEDTIFGATVSGRPASLPGVETMIGPFINTLPMRVQIAQTAALVPWLQRLQAVELDLRDYEFTPLVDVQAWSEVPRSLPLFETVLVYQSFPVDHELLRGVDSALEIRALAGREWTSQGMVLSVFDDPAGLGGALEYDAEAYGRVAVVRLLGHFAVLLGAMAEGPERRLGDLALLGEAERHQLTWEWNDTRREWPWPAPYQRAFEEQVARRPDAVAAVCREQSVTFGELNARVNRMAWRLIELGVGPDTVVPLLAARDLELLAAILGVLKAGGAYLPLDPLHPAQRWGRILECAQAPLVVRSRALAARWAAAQALLPEGTKPRALDLEELLFSGGRQDDPPCRVEPSHLGYSIFTSGSTGVPKGPLLEQRGLLNHIYALVEDMGLTERDCIAQTAAQCFDISVWQLLGPALAGGQVLIVPEEVAGDARRLLEEAERQAVTVLEPVPSLLRVMLEELEAAGRRRALGALRWMMPGGEALPEEVARRWLARFPEIPLLNAYGPAECSDDVSLGRIDRLPEDGRLRITIGRPVANVALYVLDRELRLASIGVAGELGIGGVCVGRGYLNDPRLTAESFVPDPFAGEPGARLFRSGDRARLLTAGELEFLGRIDHQIKLRGFRIELGEVEAELARQPGVEQAVVVLRDERLVAYVVPEAAAALSVARLREQLRRSLAGYMVPSAFVVLAELPLTPNGKIDRQALPAPQSAGTVGERASPRTPGEQMLAAIWEEVLAAGPVGREDDFFALGGHSLMATRVISRVREAFAVELPLRTLFECSTISSLAAAIELGGLTIGAAAQPIGRAPRESPLPLSFAQQRLWFIDQLEPDSPLYNIASGFLLSGRLDQQALARALSEVVGRHEVLRTTFPAAGGVPVQAVAPARPVPLPCLDLAALPAGARSAEVERLAGKEARRPFDLARGPLLRVVELRLAAEEHALVLVVHHIVADGWSMDLLAAEVEALYDAAAAGLPPSLPGLPIQYADFAWWQRQWLSGEVRAAEVVYWQRKLAGAPAVLELPFDRPRPAVRSRRGTVADLPLPAELYTSLLALARREGVTLFMVLLAALQALLARVSGEEDLSVGTPISGRSRLETERLIGFFVNTLVLRGDLSGDPTFGELLERTREVVLEADRHQHLPFETLVHELGVVRSLRHSPLFQVLFVLDNTPSSQPALPGLRARALKIEAGVARFDLVVSLVEAGTAFAGALEYSTELFDRTTVLRLGEQFGALLAAAARQPGSRLSELASLPESERHQLLTEWNDSAGAAGLQGPWLHEWVPLHAARDPMAPAVVASERTLTYGELDRLSSGLAERLRRRGAGAESRVGLCCERGPELVVAMIGVLKAGAAFVPLDPDYPAERLAYLLADARLCVLLTQEGLAARLPPGSAPRLAVDLDGAEPDGAAGEQPATAVAAESPAYVIYTSGSTGHPKGVVVGHGGLRNLAEAQRAVCGTEARSRVLQFASPSFDASVFEVVWALRAGAGLHVASRQDLLPGPALARLLADREITHLVLPPSALAVLSPDGLPALRVVLAAGEACPAELATAWSRGRRFVNAYGPTETTVWATHDDWRCDLHRPAIGTPIGNFTAHVLDRSFQAVPLGAPGELCLGGLGLARGYLGRPELTAEKFIPHPWPGGGAGPGSRLYRSGDLVRRLSDGRLDFLGRIDRQVKVRGFRVELGEVEAALGRLPEVAAAAVEARENAAGDRRLVGYVVARREGDVTAGELGRQLRGVLPEFMVPSAFVLLPSLPLTASGKVDRRALPAPGVDRPELGKGPVAARTPAEEILAALVGEVLGLERVGVEDDFFELGGHSLLATRLVSRVRQSFAVELPVRAVFAEPTVAAMARRVERLRQAGGNRQVPPIVRAPRDREAPLSFAQQRLWLLDQLAPGSCVYNLPAALRMTGPLDPAALAAAASEIVRRHEVLRTSFPAVDGTPVQRIAAAAPVELPLLDLGGLPEARRASELRRLAREEARRAFDLECGPVLRLRLVRLGGGEHVVLLTLHHIAADEWSIGLLIEELAALYPAFSARTASPLPEPALQYADFARWQRRWLSGAVLEEELAFWKGELAGAPPVLKLSCDRPRPPVSTLRAAQRSWRWSGALAARTRELYRREGATLFMTMLAGFAVLLSRHGGGRNLTVGTPIAGRNRLEIEELVGFFVNTLVLRVDLAGEPGFREVLAQARERTLAAHDHQDLPFETLVGELAPERSLAHAPLFQVMLVVHNPARRPLALPGLEIRSESTETGAGQFDLVLRIAELEDHLEGALEYNPDLFDAPAVERMAGHLATLLAAAVADPDTPAALLPLLTPAERHQLGEEWNDTARARAEAGVHQLFAQWSRRRPDAVALSFADRQMSFAHLDRLANRLAGRLRDLGVGPGAAVAVCLERSAELVVTLLAVLKAGGAYVPVDPAYPEQRRAMILEDTGAKLLLTVGLLASTLGTARPTTVRALCLDGDEGEAPVRREDDPAPPAAAGDLAYIIYTSGSTGRPKGVLVAHRGLANLVLSQRDLYRVGPGDRVLQFHSPGFDGSISEMFLALASGATLCVAARQTAADPEGLAELVGREQVTVAKLPPSLLAALPEVELPALRAIGSAGEACTGELVRRWSRGRRFFNAYGPTEVTVGAAMMDCTGLGLARPPIGRPLANTRIHLLDRGLQLPPCGVAGEVSVGGIGLAWGYLGQPELTAERFVPDPCGGEAGARLYRTGDLARRLPDGNLDFLGRLDDQVKVRGFRIEPGEVEAALAGHPMVRQAVVTAHGEGPGDRRLVAFIVAQAEPLPAGELREFLATRLPDHMVPTVFVPLASLPLTPNGKVDRRALPRPGGGAPATGPSAVPRTQTEELLATLWAEVLGVAAVGVDEDFFAAGGHSLLAAQLVSRVRRSFAVELPLRVLFDAPTVAGLAREIERARATAAPDPVPPLVPLPRDGPPPLSFAQLRLWLIDQLGGGSALYNLPVALRLSGRLDAMALERSVGAVVARHETLRTAFAVAGGEPVQAIAPRAGWRLATLDLTALPRRRAAPELRRLAADEASRPFDLARGPLLRGRLLRLAAAEHALLLTMHHIVSDGVSIEILGREVSRHYRGQVSGAPEELPALPVQYADYAVWQRRWLAGEGLASELAYWRRNLDGLPEVLGLPLDRPWPVRQSERGEAVPVAVAPPVAAALRSLGRGAGVTLFMTLLAAWQALLSRVTGAHDLAVGTPVAGRDQVEVEQLIGFFVNTLVLRGDLSGDPGFAELLARTRAAALDAMAHRHLPFEKLVEELQPQRSLSHSPLFQASLALHVEPPPSPRLEGLEVTPLPPSAAAPKFELSLALAAAGGALAGSLEYRSDLFDRSTAGRLAAAFERVLEAVAADPHLALSELPVLSAAERHQVVVEWSGTAAAGDGDGTVDGLFGSQAARAPDRIAVESAACCLSYGELDRRADRLALRLRTLGVGPDAALHLALERSAETVVAMVAALKAGACYVPLDPSLPAERLAQLLAGAPRPVVATTAALAASLPAHAARVLVDRKEPGAAAGEGPCGGVAEPDHLAYVMYTSGSTGGPKGVAVCHRGIVRLVRQGGFAALGPEEVFLQLAPLSFDASTLEIWGPLLNGGRLVLYPGAAGSIAELGEAVRRHGVTTLWLTAGLFHQVVDQGLPGCAGLRQLLAGGDVLSAAHVERALAALPGCRLINGYGPTENTTFTCCQALEQPLPAGRSVPIGRPIGGTQVYLLDAALRPVGIGTAGELYAGGAGLARGYAQRPDLTAERFVPAPLGGEPGARLYRTGDLARYLPGGAIEFLGRRDRQVKLRGFRVEPAEIEAALAAHPGVGASVVVAREEAPGDRRLIAYVAPPAGRGLPDLEELRQHLRACLPAYMVPSQWMALAALPLTVNGKVDYAALPTPARTPGGSAQEVPQGPVAGLLAGIWAEVLGLDRVGLEDNFFDLGGHSLLATQVVSRLRAVLAIEVPLRALFESPTLAGFARAVEEARRPAGVPVPPPIKPVGRDRELALSFAQQRLWFLEQLAPGTPAYNMPVALRLDGPLVRTALARAISEVVRRHEALRTVFPAADSRPVQAVEPARPLPLPAVDLRSLPEPLRQATARRLAAAEARRPFDLARGPLLRVKLLVLGPEAHVVLATMHHIVSDGWSLAIFAREMGVLYEAFESGRPVALPELRVQYADFADWQRGWLAGEILDRELAHWRQRLAGCAAVLALPTDRPRPALLDPRGEICSSALPAELAGRLAALSRREGTTLFMTLLAAFDVLLYRYTGQQDLSVGTPVAGRNRLEIEPLIGFFVNTLVLRVGLGGDLAFGELLSRVREAALDAHAHQDLPFEKLVEELQPQRSLAHSPLFQTMFTLLNTPSAPFAVRGLRAADVGSGAGIENFDLTLTLAESGGGLAATLSYPVELFDATSMRRMLGHYVNLLAALAAAPERALGALPLLGEAELHQLVREWNDTEAAWPGGEEGSFQGWFESQVARTPETVAASHGGEAVTYRELNRRANRGAWRLRGLGVGPEVVVPVLAERGVGLLAAMLAVLKAGGAYLPLEPRHPGERWQRGLAAAGPVAVAAGALLRRLAAVQAGMAGGPAPRGSPPRLLAVEDLLAAGGPEEDPPCRVEPGNLAYAIFTSGSTGVPKGPMLDHRGLVNHLRALVRDLGLDGADRVAQTASQVFDISVWQLLGALLVGGRICIHGDEVAHDAARLLAAVAREGVTVLEVVPSLLRAMLDEEDEAGGRPELPALRWLMPTGETLPPELTRQWLAAFPSARVLNAYGPAECTDDVAYGEVVEAPEGVARVPIGRAVANARLYLVDGELRPVPLGVPGELAVGGICVGRGYLGDALRTAEAFVPDPFAAEAGQRLYRSGDLARYLGDGRLDFVGRLDHQVKIRGLRIEPGEVEAALQRHPGVVEAVVAVRDELPGGLGLVAYMVAAGQGGPTVKELREHLLGIVPDYMLPAAFVSLAELPRLANGKLDRGALPAPAGAAGSGLGLAPRDAVELALVGLWEELLGQGPIGVEDDFFALGGYSMLAVRLMARVEERFGAQLPLAILFTAPSIARLAVEIRRNGAAAPASSPLVPIQPRGRRPPLFCVHPGGGTVFCYTPLAYHLGGEQPLYGLQAAGIDAGTPSECIEEMAASYLAALRAVQPSGPYRLAGWSLGAVVAFEMARQERARGGEVALLVMIDPPPPNQAPAARDEISLLAEFASDLGLSLERLDLRHEELAGACGDGLLGVLLGLAKARGVVREDVELKQAERLFALFKANLRALASYRPQRLDGRIDLFAAAERLAGGEPDPALGWAPLAAAGVETRVLSGSHYGLLQPACAAELAAQLEAALERSGG
ncbi:MAG TPA: non-ribosomal peptide synthase/polyketide synthase [Thermoanaerobaculia bacterium]|nr:non-ribosomal peptide synthase/polyketide synthase [Thermoanaerobaculia bacterium]